MKQKQWILIFSALLLLKCLLHFSLNGQWSFHRDELLYLALGRHLDWGYASVPPGIGFWAWVGTAILGGSVSAIRLLATLAGTTTVLLTGLMAREMLRNPATGQPVASGRFSVLLIGLGGLTCAAFLRPSMLFMPVVFDLLYWTLLCWLWLKWLHTQRDQWLLWLGVATGLGILNKYTMLLPVLGLLPAVIFTRQRRIFRKKAFYTAVLVALVLISPNVFWQYQHDFPLFRHMTELAASQFAHVSIRGFAIDQVQFFLPLLPVWLAGLYWLLGDKTAVLWRPFAWLFVVVIGVLVFFNAKSYYALGAYPVLLAAGAAFIERKTQASYRAVRWLITAFALFAGGISLPVALPLFGPEQQAQFTQKLVQYPIFEGINRWENGKTYALPQDYADMLGWQELAAIVSTAWQQIPEPQRAAIYAENYGQAGAIERLGHFRQRPLLLSFSDSYRYWLPERLPSDFYTLLYINDELGDDMPGFFAKIEKVGEINLPLSRQNGVQVYRCENPTPAFFDRINTAMYAAKNNLPIE